MILSRAQSEFIKAEFDLEVPSGIENPVSKKLWDLIRYGSFMIEGNEARKDGKLTEKCRIAMSICDMKY